MTYHYEIENGANGYGTLEATSEQEAKRELKELRKIHPEITSCVVLECEGERCPFCG